MAMDGTRPAAVGTGLLVAQAGRLLFEQRLQRAFGEAGGGGLGDLFQGVEIDVESGAALTEGATGDDFTPLRRELTEFVQLLRCETSA